MDSKSVHGSGETEKKERDRQQVHWETTFTDRPEMFGAQASEPARYAAALFAREGKKKILELGAGQGRDTLYFAEHGFEVTALDYAPAGLGDLEARAREANLSHLLATVCHDARNPLPLGDESFDACYSHMFYCMALTTVELQGISSEVKRVLKKGGLNIFTVRNTEDADYGKGIHRGEDMYEVGGFIVHFFSEKKVAQLAGGFEVVDVARLEEGKLPRRLFRVTLKKR